MVTVTKRTCQWCGRPLAVGEGPGRPRLFCRQSCRQREYEARRRAAELGLGEHELVVTRVELDALRDRVFVLGCVIEDVERDRDEGLTDDAHLLGALLDAARECVAANARDRFTEGSQMQ